MGAFHLSELAGRTIAGPVILTMKSTFPRVLLKSHLLPAHYLGFNRSGWVREGSGRSVLTNGKRPKVWLS